MSCLPHFLLCHSQGSLRAKPLIPGGFTGHLVLQPWVTSLSRHGEMSQIPHPGCACAWTSSWEPSCSDGCHSTCLPVLHSMGKWCLGTAVLLRKLQDLCSEEQQSVQFSRDSSWSLTQTPPFMESIPPSLSISV